MPKPDTFGSILRREIDRAGLSVAELSRRAETSRATLYNLLSDAHAPDFALVCRIAAALGTPTDTFRTR